jgi:hypothetical protein
MRLDTLLMFTLSAFTCVACSHEATRPPTELPMSDPEHATQPSPAPTWSVWDKNFKVLTIVGRPGPILSMAAPPPGPAKFKTHPFLSATSSSPVHEDRLRRLLHASSSIEAYLQALREAGFTIKDEAPTP